MQLDLSNPDFCFQFAKDFKQEVDILVNNGGLSQREELNVASFEILKHMMNVNCMSPIALTKGFLPMMLKS